MNIHKKLFKVTSTMDKMRKDSTNPFFGSRYFDVNQLIEAVRPALIAEDLLLLQPIEGNAVGTRIIDIDTGEYVEAFLPLPELQDPQKVGACITYYRRFTLGSLIGIEAEDLDGEDVVGRAKPKTKNNTNDDKPWLNEGMPDWEKCEAFVRSGGNPIRLRDKYKVSKQHFEYFKSLHNTN
jgi:hypothetical protein